MKARKAFKRKKIKVNRKNSSEKFIEAKKETDVERSGELPGKGTHLFWFKLEFVYSQMPGCVMCGDGVPSLGFHLIKLYSFKWNGLSQIELFNIHADALWKPAQIRNVKIHC